MDARQVTDRSEWSAIGRLATHFTHEYSWSLQAVQWIGSLLYFRAPVTPTYLRVWVDDLMYGCPFLVIGENANLIVNAPRAHPMVITGDGEPHDPVAVINAAWPKARIDFDTAHEANLKRAAKRLAQSGVTWSTAWAFSAADRDQIGDLCRWPSHWQREQWLSAVERFWRAPWRTELTTYRRDGAPTGWVIRAHRHQFDPELVTVARPGQTPPPWVSPRLPQSPA